MNVKSFPRNSNGSHKAFFPFSFHDQINLDIKDKLDLQCQERHRFLKQD